MGYSAKIIADSVSPGGARITTMQVTFPRFILAEMNTHRVFSRNYESSRAMSVERMIERVKNDPVIPVRWTASSKGMGNDEDLTTQDSKCALFMWNAARLDMLEEAQRLSNLGVHKNIVNRLLEPFCWVTGIITSTEWENFFALRCSPLAQPEMQHIADMMREAYQESQPDEAVVHLPYITDGASLLQDHADPEKACLFYKRLSAARCARVSYSKPGEGEATLADKLQADGHWSPFEHPATAADPEHMYFNLKGWKSYRYELQVLC